MSGPRPGSVRPGFAARPQQARPTTGAPTSGSRPGTPTTGAPNSNSPYRTPNANAGGAPTTFGGPGSSGGKGGGRHQRGGTAGAFGKQGGKSRKAHKSKKALREEFDNMAAPSLGGAVIPHGDGKSTRSFQYVSDLIEGLIKLMNSNYTKPVNIGNPEEYSIDNFADLIKYICLSKSTIVYLAPTSDDPKQRKPDISRAIEQLEWRPTIILVSGLKKTIEYFKYILSINGEIDIPLPRKYASISLNI
jgi:hypothetical protein